VIPTFTRMYFRFYIGHNHALLSNSKILCKPKGVNERLILMIGLSDAREDMNTKKTILVLVRHDIFLLVLIGVILRIVLMPFFIDPYDIVAQQLSLTGIINRFDPYYLSVSMYPPFVYMFLYPFMLIASRAGLVFRFYVFPVTFKAAVLTGGITSIFADPIFLVFWKIPLLVFDLLTGLLIYQLLKELTKNNAKAKKGFILWFFNPLVLFTSYVHGAFDVIAAFFILLGIYFLTKDKYLLSGISFGFGGITKISPFLIAIPLSALVFLRKTDESARIFSRKRWSNTVIFLTGCITPILVSILWNLNYYRLLVTSTLSELQINGGLNQWFFAVNWNLRSILLNPNLNVVKVIFYLYPLISLIPLLFLRKTLWNYKINASVILLFSALSIVIVYFISPATVQPQYILWLIPILTVISTENRSFYWPLTILSLTALAFFFSIEGPFYYMYPLAFFTPLYNVNQLNAVIINYVSIPAPLTGLLCSDLCLIFGAIGFLGLILTIIFVTRGIRKEAWRCAKPSGNTS
jgi:hypothetical protein